MSLPTPTLHTARLRLRPFTSAEADALFALHRSAHVLRGRRVGLVGLRVAQTRVADTVAGQVTGR
jgi:hypothetical protein